MGYRIFSVFGRWYVALGREVLFEAPNKKLARSLAEELNRREQA